MITTFIYGGLGNQLFQYSAGRALSLRHGVDLCLIWKGGSNKSRALSMMHFNLNCKILSSASFMKRINFDVVKSYIKHGSPVIFREATLGFNNQFTSLGPNICLNGYWQSEKFFTPIEDTIRQDLKILTPPSVQNQLLLEKIRSKDSIALHIRRGDYVTNPSAFAVHGTCNISYYKNAMQYITDKLQKQPVFYIFSDDIPWAMANLKNDHKMIFVNHNNDIQNYEDLRLMSYCKHNIIANSSFSWWGAWLNKNPNKIVVAPQKWYADHDTKNPDILPSNWVKL
jgi:hypothetical protein